MNKLQGNRKMLLTVIAGVLATVVVIGAGTYAWFSGGDEVDTGGGLETAEVSVEKGPMDFAAFDFFPGWKQSIAMQNSLESTFATPALKEIVWPVYNTQKKEVPTTTQLSALPFAGDSINSVYTFKNAFGTTVDTSGNVFVTNITPGSVFEGGYSFSAKTSTIPVYLRFETPSFALQGSGVTAVYDLRPMTITLTALNKTSGATEFTISYPSSPATKTADIFKVVNGYMYLALPLDTAYAWKVETSIQGYLYGSQNGPSIMDKTFVFGKADGTPLKIEVIQSTNNAVAFDPAWSVADVPFQNVAPNPLYPQFYKPYTTTNLYDAYKN